MEGQLSSCTQITVLEGGRHIRDRDRSPWGRAQYPLSNIEHSPTGLWYIVHNHGDVSSGMDSVCIGLDWKYHFVMANNSEREQITWSSTYVNMQILTVSLYMKDIFPEY